MAQRTVRILAGIGHLSVGHIALPGAIYSLRIDKAGNCEGTVHANFRPLFQRAESVGSLRLKSGQTLHVRLQWFVPYGSRAFVTADGPVEVL
jgi:hypothetical protein